jgi:Flp pilus assembly protein protease CpaA
MRDLLIIPFVLWLAICAFQDVRNGEVSNWLTLPPLGLSLVARLVGWLTTPWWTIGLVWTLAIFLWYGEKLGGADAKAWLTFSLLGDGVLWGAFVGLMIWYAAINWVTKHNGEKGLHRFPGFPGYTLGIIGFIIV